MHHVMDEEQRKCTTYSPEAISVLIQRKIVVKNKSKITKLEHKENDADMSSGSRKVW